jgi:hypothetical protein
MAYNCKISYVSRFILFHKRKDAMIRLNPVCGVALTATKSMDEPAIRKSIRSTTLNCLADRKFGCVSIRAYT